MSVHEDAYLLIKSRNSVCYHVSALQLTLKGHVFSVSVRDQDGSRADNLVSHTNNFLGRDRVHSFAHFRGRRGSLEEDTFSGGVRQNTSTAFSL